MLKPRVPNKISDQLDGLKFQPGWNSPCNQSLRLQHYHFNWVYLFIFTVSEEHANFHTNLQVGVMECLLSARWTTLCNSGKCYMKKPILKQLIIECYRPGESSPENNCCWWLLILLGSNHLLYFQRILSIYFFSIFKFAVLFTINMKLVLVYQCLVLI